MVDFTGVPDRGLVESGPEEKETPSQSPKKGGTLEERPKENQCLR